MLPGMELMGCQGLAVPGHVMHHVVQVESAYNPYAIGVVGGRLQRQPKTLDEAVATAAMLEEKGYNFSLGLAQVNRYNLKKYGLQSLRTAFDVCRNLRAGSRILAECYQRSGNDWGKSFSCYYSGNFVTGYRHGYVQKVYASMQRAASRPAADTDRAILLVAERVAAERVDTRALGRAAAAQVADIAASLVLRRALPVTTALAATTPPPPATPSLPTPTVSTAEVFVPQVRALGEAPETTTAASPPMSAADPADLRQETADNARVF
jgi:type IV secretion system protein VirB1